MLPTTNFHLSSEVSHVPRFAYASSDSEPERERERERLSAKRAPAPAPAPAPASAATATAPSSHAWRSHEKNVYASLKKVDPSTNYKEAMKHARASYTR
jgi:hypothetical protein